MYLMRVLVNYMLRKETWFVHAIAGDAATSISPILEVRDQVTLLRLLLYIGASEANVDEVNMKIGRWSRGCTWIELAPGRRNLLRIRQPWSELAGLADTKSAAP
jgi:hypothetical protein